MQRCQPCPDAAFRYLYTELSEASFGDRASAILTRFREADPTSTAMAGIAIQGQMMAQLSYIVDQLKVTTYSIQCGAVTAVHVEILCSNNEQQQWCLSTCWQPACVSC